jgi:multiple sugar transport system substrate-binding protein
MFRRQTTRASQAARITPRIAASLLVAALVTSCVGSTATGEGGSGDSNQSVTLRFSMWSNNEAHVAMLEGFAREFRKTHPNVSVEFVPVISSDYLQKISTALAGGRPFDAGWLGEGDVSQFVAAGVLADLAPTLSRTKGYELNDFIGKSMQSWRRGDKIYGVPFSTSPFLVYYNKDLFAQAGVATPEELTARGEWTWENFRAIARTIREKAGPSVYGFQGHDGALYDNVTSFWNTVVPAIRAYGGSIWDPSTGSCDLADQATVDAIDLFRQMVAVDKSMVPPGEQADFFAGQVGMTINQLSRTSLLEEATFEWGIAPLPSGPAGPTSFYGQAGVVVFNASPHPDIAAEFVAFMTNRQNVETMAEFFPPARQSVLDSPAFRSSNAAVGEAGMELVADQVRQGESFPFPANFADVNLALKPELDKLWSADADVAAILRQGCEAVESLLTTS